MSAETPLGLNWESCVAQWLREREWVPLEGGAVHCPACHKKHGPDVLPALRWHDRWCPYDAVVRGAKERALLSATLAGRLANLAHLSEPTLRVAAQVKALKDSGTYPNAFGGGIRDLLTKLEAELAAACRAYADALGPSPELPTTLTQFDLALRQAWDDGAAVERGRIEAWLSEGDAEHPIGGDDHVAASIAEQVHRQEQWEGESYERYRERSLAGRILSASERCPFCGGLGPGHTCLGRRP